MLASALQSFCGCLFTCRLSYRLQIFFSQVLFLVAVPLCPVVGDASVGPEPLEAEECIVVVIFFPLSALLLFLLVDGEPFLHSLGSLPAQKLSVVFFFFSCDLIHALVAIGLVARVVEGSVHAARQSSAAKADGSKRAHASLMQAGSA